MILRAWRLVRSNMVSWRGWTLIFFVTLATAGFGLAQPWPMKLLVDYALTDVPVPEAVRLLPGTGGTMGILVWAVVLSVVLFAVNSALGAWLTILWVRVGQGMVYRLARRLFGAMQRKSLLFHSRHPIGDLISRVADDSWVVHKLVDSLFFEPLYALLVTVPMIAVMWNLDWQLTAISLAVVPVMMIAAVALGRPIRRAAQDKRKVEGEIHSHVQRTLNGIPIVQAFGQEERHDDHMSDLTTTAIKTYTRGVVANKINNLGTGLPSHLGMALILWVAAHRVIDGAVTVGSVLVFLSYLRNIQQQFRNLTSLYTSFQGARANLDRVFEILDEGEEVSDRPGAVVLGGVSGRVTCDSVVFGYEPGRPVLHDVSFEVEAGQTLALVGHTGAGKSTLVSLVPRFFDVQEGRVLVDGCDVRDVTVRSLREHVSVVLQEPFLFPMSVADNIGYGRPGASREEIVEAAKIAQAHEFIERLADGYDTVIGERGSTLSGGERQRVSIARAILKDAPILILDEPTSALDAETEGLLMQGLDRLMEGRTTLVIAHRLSTVRRADQIVVLQDGRLVERGSHDELLAHDGVYARMHHLQHSNIEDLEVALETLAGDRLSVLWTPPAYLNPEYLEWVSP